MRNLLTRVWPWSVAGAARNAQTELRDRELAVARVDAACRRLAPQPERRAAPPRSA